MANYRPRLENLQCIPRCDDSTGPLADNSVGTRLEVHIDLLVRAIPNRSGWLRRVITEAAVKEFGVPPESPDCPCDQTA